ncbi:mucin-6 [Mergus octosetaceus]
MVMSKDSCSTWGGGHFSTFDKYQYDFTGTCNYIFATVCDESSPDFNVQFRRGLDKKIARIIIELGPSVIIVEKESISVRSVGVIKLPYANNGIQIAPYGRSTRLVAKLMEMELVVMWNNEDYLMVLAEKKYMGKTCGMCGNYDGYELNDFVSEGKLLDAYKYAALQKMDDPSEICLSEEIPIPAIPHKKYSSSLPNNGTLMAVYEKSGYSHSETSLSAIIYLSTKDKIVISQNELLTDDDELKRLPYRSGDITIFRQSSMFIQIHTVFGLEVLVQTSPVFQAYVKVGSQFKGRTLGLCGNYNGDTTDDFMTSMDITEGTASLFVDSWRAGNCNPALERETDPCALSQLNTIPCTGNQTFSYNTQACDRTCLSLSYRALECHPTDIPIEGCHCPKGTYLNHKNECVRKSHCPCYLEDRKYILPDQSTMSGGITCYCVNGRLSCTGKPQNPAESCRAPKKYISCSDNLENKYGATCAPTCQMLATGIECIPTKCESGCVCADGLYENLDGRCVPAEDCPCEYGGLAYGRGEQIQTECEICTCRKGKWKCVQKSKCSSTCNLYGEGHITTFDGQRFVFDGNCEYILAMDGCSVNRPHSSFKIITENVICGKSGVTCSRSISIYLGNLTLVLRDETFSVSGENPLVRYSVKKNALHLMFDIIIPGKYNMTLIWNKHMNFFIKISRETQETICGLCGNYNGNMKDDFETRSKYVASNELEFVNSWKENPLCGDVYFVVDPCSKNPYRKAWAEKTCSIINSQVFSACHNKVNRMPYYEACVRDSCGCDIGGDCECMCDAIAVYAMACLDKGICIDWRTPEFCPVYCEYYNSHKNTGSGGALSYAYNNDNCTWHYRPCNCPNQNYKYVNIEGCYNCSHDEYFDYETEKCMPCGYESISTTPETSPLTVTTVQPNITRSSTAVTSPATMLPASPAITSSASTVSTETMSPPITSKITIPTTSSATPLVTIKSTTEHTTLVFTTPSMTTTVTTPSITTSTKRTTSSKPISTPTASSTTASTETEKVRVTTPLFETPTEKEMTTTSIPSHTTSQIATSSQPELTTWCPENAQQGGEKAVESGRLQLRENLGRETGNKDALHPKKAQAPTHP